jgi:hypothetical protein
VNPFEIIDERPTISLSDEAWQLWDDVLDGDPSNAITLEERETILKAFSKHDRNQSSSVQ